MRLRPPREITAKEAAGLAKEADADWPVKGPVDPAVRAWIAGWRAEVERALVTWDLASPAQRRHVARLLRRLADYLEKGPTP